MATAKRAWVQVREFGRMVDEADAVAMVAIIMDRMKARVGSVHDSDCNLTGDGGIKKHVCSCTPYLMRSDREPA